MFVSGEGRLWRKVARVLDMGREGNGRRVYLVFAVVLRAVTRIHLFWGHSKSRCGAIEL